MKIDFSPQKNLFSLPIVQWGGGFILSIAIISSVLIAYDLRHIPFEFNSNGFEKFANHFKVPATFLAIMAAFIGLCAANHRSEQSKEQIKLTSEQNTFSNHYKHLEEFENFLKIIHEKEQEILEQKKERYKKDRKFETLVHSELLGPHIDTNQYRSLYRMIYPKSNSGNFKPSFEYKNSINSFTKFILETYPTLFSNNVSVVKDGILNTHIKTKEFKSKNFINIDYDTYEFARLKDKTLKVPHGDFMFVFIEAFGAIDIINRVMDFDFNHQTTDEFEKIKFLNNPDKLETIKLDMYSEKSSLFT